MITYNFLSVGGGKAKIILSQCESHMKISETSLHNIFRCEKGIGRRGKEEISLKGCS